MTPLFCVLSSHCLFFFTSILKFPAYLLLFFFNPFCSKVKRKRERERENDLVLPGIRKGPFMLDTEEASVKLLFGLSGQREGIFSFLCQSRSHCLQNIQRRLGKARDRLEKKNPRSHPFPLNQKLKSNFLKTFFLGHFNSRKKFHILPPSRQQPRRRGRRKNFLPSHFGTNSSSSSFFLPLHSSKCANASLLHRGVCAGQTVTKKKKFCPT